MPATGSKKALVDSNVQVEARCVHVFGEFVAELDADVGLVGRFVAREAGIAINAHQGAAHLARVGTKMRRKALQLGAHLLDEVERRFAHQRFVTRLVGLEPDAVVVAGQFVEKIEARLRKHASLSKNARGLKLFENGLVIIRADTSTWRNKGRRPLHRAAKSAK